MKSPCGIESIISIKHLVNERTQLAAVDQQTLAEHIGGKRKTLRPGYVSQAALHLSRLDDVTQLVLHIK